jgi:kynureninase
MTTPTGAADDPLLAHRASFPILARTNYLISNSLGAVPAAAFDGLRDYVETWASRGVRAWEEAWWGMVAELGDRVAPLIGAGPGQVVFQPNVTLAHAVLFSAFDYRAGRPKVVTDAMHFPSILYLLAEQSAHGAEVVVVPTRDGIAVDTGRLVEAIDERTAFVNVSHVLFKSAYIHDVAAIAARARAVGALSIVDGYQSVGAIPVDVEALGVDAYVGGCLKWLCGGPGAAFLWVRPEARARLVPRLTGWMAHARPFAFAPALERRDDAWRFLHGTPNVPALYAARPGLEVIRRVGVAAIRAKSLRQTARLLSLAEARGWRCTTPRDPARRGGTVALDVPHGLEVSKALKAREVLCDYRPGAGVRLSPHFYNRDDELDAAVAAIAEILDEGLWRAYAERPSAVT